MVDVDSSETAALASYDLPASPSRSPTGSDNMSVWVEDAGGEQRVRVALTADVTPSPSFPVPLSATPEAMDFPLVLCETNTSNRQALHLSGSSSAIVPFQKLQLDTNLNQTLLPYKSVDTVSNSSASSNSNSPVSSPGASSASRSKAKQFASSFLARDAAESEFMNYALRLGDLRPQEPQLSVRLRGSRVELASASEENDVHFLGPAENIKKLFKLPYSQARVSLAVHRVGSTLVVDGELEDSDLPAGFEDLPQETMKIQQQSEETTQNLLYEKFIYESTMQGWLTDPGPDGQQQEHPSATKPKKYNKKKKKKQKAAVKQAAIAQEEPSEDYYEDEGADGSKTWISSTLRQPSDVAESSSYAGVHNNGTNSDAPATTGPKKTSTSPSSSFSPPQNRSSRSWTRSPPTSYDLPTFQRILKWKFHDLKMILGSQVLLFSNQEHPAVSLRLHDMDKELSLLTVLDYYLDNVIANIPELAICMHSNGLVRGYKLVETRQIPYMSGTGRPLFDVQDVSMNASMLLKFLQENCSRPDGTYWLYRKEGENSLRLYDVNVLSQGKQLKWKYMMAMLCYRFASRASRLMYFLANDTPRLQQQLQQRQRDLLRTCIKLLEEISQAGGSSHKSICASVSEQLADTYLRECDGFQIPSNSNTKGRTDDTLAERQAAIKALEKAKTHLQESIRSFEECISQDANSALPHGNSESGIDDKDIHDENDLEEEEDYEEEGMGSFMEEELERLQLKFSSACLQLGRVFFESDSWVEALNAIRDSCKYLPLSSIPSDVKPLCGAESHNNEISELLDKVDFDGIRKTGYDGSRSVICSTGIELRCYLLELLGDMASRQPVIVSSALVLLYEIISGEKKEQLQLLALPGWEKKADIKIDVIQDNSTELPEERLLRLSFIAYLRALSPCVDSELYFMLMKKLGNASNELGKYYLAIRRDYEKAFQWFERGGKIFNDIEDGINIALLNANLAHLHKILAQGKGFTAREEHYRAAIQLCTEALQHLKQNKAALDLRQKVKGELALTYLVWSVNMANNFMEQHVSTTGNEAKKQRENEALKTFNKALTLYTELDDQKQIASTHYQMASFHNRIISRDIQNDGTLSPSPTGEKEGASTTALKNRMEIARRHYEKALHYFGKMEVGKTFVLIHQELADLYAIGGHTEDIEHALLIMLNTYDGFNNVRLNESAPERDAMGSLAREVVAKVKLILHQLIRLCSSSNAQPNGTGAHNKAKKLEMFKKMYKEVIYYDGHSAGSIVPMLGTLRSMYLL